MDGKYTFSLKGHSGDTRCPAVRIHQTCSGWMGSKFLGPAVFDDEVITKEDSGVGLSPVVTAKKFIYINQETPGL